MARLIYSAIASLDGYVEDSDGQFDWSTPDDEVLSIINDLERPIGTYLYGRRMYETMLYWETATEDNDEPAAVRDFAALWHRADKIVYSRTLTRPASARTRIERTFDPSEVRRLKLAASQDLTIGGADLGGQAIEAGLVDEFQLFAVPVIVGGGKPWLAAHCRMRLELVESRSFASGVVLLRYRPAAR